MNRKLGKIFCSGPTNIAVDNLAARLDTIDASVVARYNKDRVEEARRSLVIRAYKWTDEIEAFWNLLKKLESGDEAAPNRIWKAASRWKLHLSFAARLLALPGSKAVGISIPDTNEAVCTLRRQIEDREDLVPLRALTAGEMTWEEYRDGPTFTKDKIPALMEELASDAGVSAMEYLEAVGMPVYRLRTQVYVLLYLGLVYIC